MYKYQTINNLNIRNKTLFIRTDMNIPLTDNGQIADNTKIIAGINTIKYALSHNAKIILATHLGRPQENEAINQLNSVQVIAEQIQKLLSIPIPITNFQNQPNWHISPLYMLENVRLNLGEANNSISLSKQYAQLADIFVHDAFATAHRRQASTYGVGLYINNRCAGLLFDKEYQALSTIMNSKGLKISIIGGAKISTKLKLIQNLAPKINYLCLGGGILNIFLKAQGFNIGKSLAELNMLEQAIAIIKTIPTNKIIIPQQLVTTKQFNSTANTTIKNLNDIQDDDIIIDIAPNSAKLIAKQILQAEQIIWNGPLGIFEWDNASYGTKTIAESIALSSGYSVAGGGDSIAAINKFNIKGINYISTAGGAMLDFLSGEIMPGLELLSS